MIALAPVWASAEELPRVVSVNLCTDQLVMLVADPTQIVSLTELSDDPRSSSMAEEAEPFAKNNARAESIAITAPDIVVAGAYSDPLLIDMLRRIDIEVVQFPLTTTIDEVPAQLRKMGDVLNRSERAEDLASDFEMQLSKRTEVDHSAPVGAFFYPNGFALGEGTLSHSILTAGGARNLSVDLGFSGNGRISLEQMVLNTPDFLISSPKYSGFSQSEDVMTHPALQGAPVMYSSADWVCGTPAILRAVSEVKKMVQRLSGVQ
ncbi:ABC transporter substrate-binding protein [Marivita sp. XM-24bin2]|uniref:ABC transporter substrate-binding protein n=1 Tax=unclassified Marivita TaxID=2632480 RepID=UPI0025C2E7D5|nr:ABC transporter substrate-binding protein [Marivita sp. XM-24bin2]MCR9109079.1 ABC transporter substrate-binding protein [Paracoccaceae bacterium]